MGSVSFVDEPSRASPVPVPTSTEKSRSTTTTSSRSQGNFQSTDRFSRSQSLGRVDSSRYEGRSEGRRLENDRNVEDRYGRSGYDGEGMTISDFFRYGGRTGRQRESRSQNFSPRSQSLGRFEFDREDKYSRRTYDDEMERHPRDYYMDRYSRDVYPERFGRDFYGDRYSRDYYGDRPMRPYEERSYYGSDRYANEKMQVNDPYERMENERFASSRMGWSRSLRN